MIIAVTKIIAQLIYPLNLALALAACAIALMAAGRRRAAAALLALAVAWLWCWSTPVVSDAVRMSLERRYPPIAAEDMPEAGAIVVLGGAVAPADPPRRYPDLSSAADRVWHAARLYHAERAPLVILSGGGFSQPESDAMAVFLMDLGVPEAAIRLESDSRTTHENARFTRPILEEEDIRDILLVTSAMHMPRAMHIFRANGMQPIPAAADHEVAHEDTRPKPLQFMPDARALEGATRAFKEYLGILGYGIQQRLHRTPAHGS